jgi:predicted glutamine amidotransferase
VGSIYPQEATRRSHDDKDARHAVVVSSERLTESAAWVEVPINHVVQITRGRAPALRACTVPA